MKRLTMTVLAACAMLCTYGKSFSLDLRESRKGSAKMRLVASAKSQGDGTLRSFNLGAGVADVGEVAVGDELTFTLFDDVTLKLTLKEQMQSPLGGDAFLAEAEGYEGVKAAVVLRSADGLTIDVQDFINDKVYKVISTPSGVKVSEIKPSHEGKCGCDALEPPPMGGPQASAADIPKSSVLKSAPRLMSAGDQSDTCVDILVAYDKNAAAYVNSNGGGITNFAQVAVQKMNAALANTGLDASFRFRLVGVCAVNVSATDVHAALYALRDDEEGWSDIKAVREVVGADIVTTLIDTGTAYGTTGVGWSLSSESSLSTFGSSAYNVCAVRSVEQSYTMAHECGHNLGAGHSDIQDTDPGPQLYGYSSGYYFSVDGDKYHTIMAYGSEGPGGTEVPYFSSPDFSYEGVAVGDATHDNTRTIATTFSYAANWNAQKVPMSYDVTFEPVSGALIDGSLDVTLVPGKSGVEVRYTLDGSDPTVSSSRYTGPVRVTGTTTIKAVTVVNGKCSLPFAATYYSKNDIGYASGLSDLEWTTTESYPWIVDTERSIDGLSVKGEVGVGSNAVMSVRITGPATMTFYQYIDKAWGYFRIFLDDDKIDEITWAGSSGWNMQSVEIPSGEHDVRFSVYCSSAYGSRTSVKCWLDDFHVYYVPKPVFEPATTDSAETAYSFTGETMVSIAAADDDTKIYYTLDGSDPNGEDAILYEGPFFINKSTRLNAIAVQPGRGASAVASGQYIERHRPQPGEWTRNGDGAFEAVKEDGRMICVMQWNYPGCGYSSAFYPIAENDVFKTWAAVNGIYLVAVDCYDAYEEPGTESSSRHFSPLYSQTGLNITYFPKLVFASASDTTTALGGFWGCDYMTVSGLVEKFASYLDAAKPLGAPVASDLDANGKTFPFSVTLSNTNGTGTIYYTLDGSAPTREKGIRYTGAINIPSAGTTLKAVVWPSNADAVSGIPLSITYQLLDDAIGVPGVTWTDGAPYTWSVDKTSSGATLNGYRDFSLASGSVKSSIKASVYGPGEFHFDYNFQPWYSTLEFKVNGTTVRTWSYAQERSSTNYVVTASGKTEFEWVYNYSYRDASYSYLGCTMSGISWTPYSAPAAPTDLTASHGEYAYGTLLRWTASGNAKEYVVYRGTTSSASAAVKIGTTKQQQYWDRECEAGKTHWYWVKAENGHGESEFSMSASGWRPVVFSITYNANGGTGKVDSQTCVSGESLTVSGNGFRFSGYIFVGWATSTDGTVAYGPGDSITPTADMILYAVWEASPFVFGGDAEWTRLDGDVWQSGAIDDNDETWIQQTVSGPGTITFDWNVSSEGGYDKLRFLVDGTEKNAISGTSGTWMTKSYEVEGSGEHVLRWVYSKDSSSDSGSDCGWIRNVAWSAIVTVTFDANGGTGGTSVSLHSGDVLSMPTVVRTGYALNGWTPDVPATAPESNATYVAQWTPNRHVVTFDANGGEGGWSEEMDYGTEIVAPTVAWAGHTFAGWSPEVVETVPDEDVTYVAQWTANQYTVTFDANGGEGGWSRSLEYGATITAPTVTLTGHAFAGWTPEVAETVPANNVTYTAQWTVNKYTVTFDANGGTGGWSRSMDYGTEIVAPTVTWPGHTFTGWAPSVAGTVPAGGATYVAQWDVRRHTVTLSLNGGEGEGFVVVEYGTKVGDIAEPTRTGHTFAGWFTVAEDGEPVDGETLVTGDIELHAQWTANKYTVTFDANGGEGGWSEEMDYGTEIVAPTVAWEGHTFAGWSPEVVETVPDEDVTYVAQWTANQYTVTFDANGGEGGWSRSLEYGATITAPTVTLTGHAFAGWTPEVAETVPAGNVTYTAQWTVNKYTVTFDANGGTGGWSRSMDYGTEIVAPTVTWPGHTFTGWAPSVAGTVPAGGATYVAQWDVRRHTVTLSLNGGEGEGFVVVEYGTKVGDIAEPTRTGHTFAGWFTAAEDGEPIDGETLVTGDIELHAQWTPNRHVVTFDANGGEGGWSEEMDYGSEIVAPTVAWAGHTFAGWSPEVVETVPDEDVTYVAQWTANQYMVTFDANGGEGGWSRSLEYGATITAPTVKQRGFRFVGWEPQVEETVPTNDVTYVAQWEEAGCSITLDYGYGEPESFDSTEGSAIGELPVPTRSGYAFTGWYTAKSGGTKVTVETIVTDDMTLYARWTAAWTVTLNANGGTLEGEAGEVSALKVSVPKGKTFGALGERALPVPAKAGYAFKGWFTKKSGGTKITTKTKVTKNITWYAQWTVKKYKVAVKKIGKGTVSGAGTKAYKSKVTLKAKAANGYVFQGWYLDDVLKSQKTSYTVTVPLDGVTYTAKFITKAVDKAGIGMEFGGVGVGGALGERALPAMTNVCGVVTTWPVAASGLTAVSVSVSGQPKGMKYDAKKKAVTGVATVASKSGTMKITVKSAGASRTWSVKWRTVALPTWAVGTFKGTLYDGDGEGTASKGTVTLTVGKTGKISGKFVDTKKKAYSFSAASFKSFEDGVLRTKATMKYGTKSVTLEIAVGQNGETSVGFAEVGSTVAPFNGGTAVLVK